MMTSLQWIRNANRTRTQRQFSAAEEIFLNGHSIPQTALAMHDQQKPFSIATALSSMVIKSGIFQYSKG